MMSLDTNKPIDIFEEVKKLGFPIDQYVVVGSGIMAAKGIRPAYDMDIVVSEELFEQCRNEGWELMPWTRRGALGREWLRKGIVELLLHVGGGTDDFSDLNTLKRDGIEIINDVPFFTLEQLIRFKRVYGRPKDFEDIKLIEEYIDSHR